MKSVGRRSMPSPSLHPSAAQLRAAYAVNDPLPYEEVIDLDGIPVRTVNLEGLLRTKQSERQRDVEDRAVIERALAKRP